MIPFSQLTPMPGADTTMHENTGVRSQNNHGIVFLLYSEF